ncbi:AAA family ATPase [Shivajiella indica]|uniref:AAA family ATPase n=1 Tax=Shivajiella indica TaxID=872115 RepID=A0ABW5B6B3_9BACT
MLKKVVVIGPESTGKSTLSQTLAAHFSVPWVPEYAREYLEKLDRSYQYDDLLKIAKGQVALEEKEAEKAKNLLICDTDLHVIKVWSEHKFGKVDEWILDQIRERIYDAYLLTDIDIPWQEDPLREHPEPKMRRYLFDWYQRLIQQSGVPFIIVSGSEEERLRKSIAAVDTFMKG